MYMMMSYNLPLSSLLSRIQLGYSLQLPEAADVEDRVDRQNTLETPLVTPGNISLRNISFRARPRDELVD
jgi:hypothetical protein